MQPPPPHAATSGGQVKQDATLAPTAPPSAVTGEVSQDSSGGHVEEVTISGIQMLLEIKRIAKEAEAKKAPLSEEFLRALKVSLSSSSVVSLFFSPFPHTSHTFVVLLFGTHFN
jgi:hypothetical protein